MPDELDQVARRLLAERYTPMQRAIDQWTEQQQRQHRRDLEHATGRHHDDQNDDDE